MEKWLESVYSDGTAEFVSNPSPKLFETVKVRIRMYADAPVKHVLLRSNPNGEEHYEEMQVVKTEHGLKYYEAPLRISENRMPYQFYLVCADVVYFYTQHGITTYIPDFTYAADQVVSIARFWGDEAYVMVMSTADEDQTIRLPLGIVGAAEPGREVFGRELEYKKLDDTSIELNVKAHQAYLMECQMK